MSPQELVLRRLLPMAEAGLDAFGVDPDVRDRYLRVIEGRCLRRQNGAVWQRSALAARERAGDDRDRALAGMLSDYLDRMHDGEPVHTWSW